MNILHIDTGAAMRGGQHQVRLLLPLLQQAGVNVQLLAREDSPLATEARSINLPVDAATLRNLFRYSQRADLTHVHDAYAHTLASIACLKPIVVSRRVAFPVKTSLLSRWKYQRAERFLAVSEFVAKQLKAAGIPERKIDIVYDAFETREEGIWNPNAPAVTIQSTDPAKGRDLIEEAAKQAHIRVTYSSNLPQDLHCASMFVYITRSEGFGSAAIMAMQMGIPVVASRTGGLAEVFEHERSGLYTENQPTAIANAMRRILDDRELTYQMIVDAKARVHEKFSPELLVARTVAAYRRTLGE